MAETIPFRNRAHEVSRLEAFSDVIFGFSISLLVVSLEAPKSFEELMEMMHGLLPFAIAFFVMIDVWVEHHAFFRRYALDDTLTIALNNILLFVILFYVYPLKFVFVMAVRSVTGEARGITADQARTLFLLYGAGFAAVFILLGFMYRHAWNRRADLQLNEVEEIDTRESILDNFATAGIGILSMLVGLLVPNRLVALGGFVYFLIGIPKALIPSVMRPRRKKAQERMLAMASSPEAPG